MKELLFMVGNRTTGDVYKIFTNGEIEGFGNDAFVINRFPSAAQSLHELTQVSASPNQG